MLIFDTSAYINGWRDHYPPSTFPSVWTLIEEAISDGRIRSPREVLNELARKDDDVSAWAKKCPEAFIEATEDVTRQAGLIQASFASPGTRDGADPWVVAEARVKGLTVVTYEGRTFAGARTKRWEDKMPGICGHHGVPVMTLPEALGLLGGAF
jgi:hypothetical protein